VKSQVQPPDKFMFVTAALREEHKARLNAGTEAQFEFADSELTVGTFTLFVLEVRRTTKTKKRLLEEAAKNVG